MLSAGRAKEVNMDKYLVLDLYEVYLTELTLENISDFTVSDGKPINNWNDINRVIKWYDEETDGENQLYVLERNGRLLNAYNKRFCMNLYNYLCEFD